MTQTNDYSDNMNGDTRRSSAFLRKFFKKKSKQPETEGNVTKDNNTIIDRRDSYTTNNHKLSTSSNNIHWKPKSIPAPLPPQENRSEPTTPLSPYGGYNFSYEKLHIITNNNHNNVNNHKNSATLSECIDTLSTTSSKNILIQLQTNGDESAQALSHSRQKLEKSKLKTIQKWREAMSTTTFPIELSNSTSPSGNENTEKEIYLKLDVINQYNQSARSYGVGIPSINRRTNSSRRVSEVTIELSPETSDNENPSLQGTNYKPTISISNSFDLTKMKNIIVTEENKNSSSNLPMVKRLSNFKLNPTMTRIPPIPVTSFNECSPSDELNIEEDFDTKLNGNHEHITTVTEVNKMKQVDNYGNHQASIKNNSCPSLNESLSPQSVLSSNIGTLGLQNEYSRLMEMFAKWETMTRDQNNAKSQKYIEFQKQLIDQQKVVHDMWQTQWKQLTVVNSISERVGGKEDPITLISSEPAENKLTTNLNINKPTIKNVEVNGQNDQPLFLNKSEESIDQINVDKKRESYHLTDNYKDEPQIVAKMVNGNIKSKRVAAVKWRKASSSWSRYPDESGSIEQAKPAFSITTELEDSFRKFEEKRHRKQLQTLNGDQKPSFEETTKPNIEDDSDISSNNINESIKFRFPALKKVEPPKEKSGFAVGKVIDEIPSNKKSQSNNNGTPDVFAVPFTSISIAPPPPPPTDFALSKLDISTKSSLSETKRSPTTSLNIKNNASQSLLLNGSKTLDVREELMLAIRSAGGFQSLKKTPKP